MTTHLSLYKQRLAGGILDKVSETVVALEVREGAHHLDLMWAEDDDPQSVRDVREEERACMKRWIMQYTNTQAKLESANPPTLLRSAASA